jgi:hypothetical protein
MKMLTDGYKLKNLDSKITKVPQTLTFKDIQYLT